MTSPPPPHILIQSGPEKGRELVIPEDGARLGRATENDISIADATMSRFQCRLYFRDGFLHIMDLGSTNESLVNNQPVTDQALRYGDEILIGESILRVVNDGISKPALNEDAPAAIADPGPSIQMGGDESPAPIVFQPDAPEPTAAAAPAPVPVAEPVAAPAPGTNAPAPVAPTPSVVEEVDLGFGKSESQDEENEKSPRGSNVLNLLLTLVVMLLLMGIFAVFYFQPNNDVVIQDNDNSLQLEYEKVESGNGNIFRYSVMVDTNGLARAEVHDLKNQRDIILEEQIDAEVFEEFRNQMLNQQDTFFALRSEYEGQPVGDHESYDILLVFGREAKRVRVANQLEPDAFLDLREKIESFAADALGLITVDMSPEKLREEAQLAWLNAQKLYEEREIQNRNLWQATQNLKDVQWLLQTIEPKPEYYEQAVRLREQWLKELYSTLNSLEFEAARARQIGDLQSAIGYYRRILATFPEENHEFYKNAYNTLTRLEQEVN